MDVSRVKIDNFRSVSSTEFKIEKDITAFVGGNETGKSNILRAINNFFSENPFSQEDQYLLSDEKPQITVEFHLTEEENQKIEEISGMNFGGKITITKTEEGKKIKNEEFENFTGANKQEEAEKEEDSEEEGGNVESDEQEKQPGPINKEEIEKEILKLIPKSILVNVDGLITGRNISIADMKANPDLPVNKTIHDFLAIGGISVKILENTSLSQSDKAGLLKKSSALIAKKLREYWGQEDIQVEITTDNSHFTIKFLDGGNRPGWKPNPRKTYTADEVEEILREAGDSTKWIWTCPEERSNGFRWFVTFYSRYIHGVESESNIILLIDDLGNYLHAAAQRELLEKLKGLGIQVIYATHSFYMVSWNFRDRIYLVNKDEQGTKTNDKWWSKLSSREIKSPLKEIGVNSIVNFLILSKKNLIVDGILDIFVMNRLAEIFSDEVDEPFLDFDFYAAQGYSETEELGQLCKRMKKTAFLLYDSTPEEQHAFRKARMHRLEATHLKLLASTRSYPIQTIEDFLPRDLFFNETKRICGEILSEEWIGFEARGSINPGVLLSLETRIKRAGIDNDEYKDLQINKIIKEKVVPAVVDKMTKGDFENTEQTQAILKFLTNLKSRLSSL